MMYESKRLILKHPDFSDWVPMLHNVWCHEETARYMLWSITNKRGGCPGADETEHRLPAEPHRLDDL